MLSSVLWFKVCERVLFLFSRYFHKTNYCHFVIIMIIIIFVFFSKVDSRKYFTTLTINVDTICVWYIRVVWTTKRDIIANK